jgi:hypothetical protein
MRAIRRTFKALMLGLIVLVPAPAAAEWQIKPFFGLTFAGETTFIDLEQAAGERHRTFGVSGVLLGEVFGAEVDFAHAPGFFQFGEATAVQHSSMTTLMGSVVVALPRRVVEYSLRPYAVAGAGMMRVRIDEFFDVFPVADSQLALVFGGGVTGFFSDRFGVSWDLRRFSRVPGDEAPGISPDDPNVAELSFWRATMSFAFRY